MSRIRNCWITILSIGLSTGVVQAAGVVGWYPFEDNAADSSGHGHDGTVVGGPTYVIGLDGQAAQFAVAADGVSLGVLPLPSAVTVSVWARFGSDHTCWLVDQTGIVGSNWYGWVLKVSAQADQFVPTFQLGNGTATRISVWDSTYSTLWDMYNPANPNQWHHIVATHDGISTARVYLNGRLYAQNTSVPYVSAASQGIGAYIRRPNNSSGKEILDDVLILDRAIDAGEVTDLYEKGVSWPLSVSPGNVQTLIALKDSPAPTLAYSVYNDDGGAAHTVDIAEVDAGGNSVDHTWLTLSTSQLVDLAASSSAPVDITIDHAALAPGDHSAYLKFSTPARVVVREIQLTVLGCEWTVTPGALSRRCLVGSTDPVVPMAYRVTNTGKHGLSYTVQEVVDQPWLTLDKSGGGPLDHQASDNVTVSMNPAGLPVGQHTCVLRFTNSCDPADVQDRTVTLAVEEYVWARGLLAYHPFEASAVDWTGNGWNGVLTGAPVYAEGRNGMGIRFDGPATGSDGVNLGPIPCPAAGSQEMTVAVWFKAGAKRKSWVIDKVTWDSVNNYWRGWSLRADFQWEGLGWEEPVIRFQFAHDGVRDYLDTSGPNQQLAAVGLYDGTWHQIVMTVEDCDGAAGNKVNIRGYYDGVVLEGPNIWNRSQIYRYEALNTAFEPADVNQPVWISGNPNPKAADRRVSGTIDEVSLWNRALSAEEVKYLFDNAFFDTRIWADADTDGDVDMDDFAVMQRCATYASSGIVDPSTCSRFDRNDDGQIDLVDFAEFESCATGPARPLDVNSPPTGCVPW